MLLGVFQELGFECVAELFAKGKRRCCERTSQKLPVPVKVGMILRERKEGDWQWAFPNSMNWRSRLRLATQVKGVDMGPSPKSNPRPVQGKPSPSLPPNQFPIKPISN